MKPPKLIATLMITVLTLEPLLAAGAEPTSDPEATGHWVAQAPAPEGGFLLHWQAAMNFRISGGQPVDSAIQVALTLAGMKWDKRHSTWGLGGRVVLDDFGTRGGPLGLWRTPLGAQRGAYFQAAAGWYLFGEAEANSYMVGDAPGYFLEAEIAPNNLIALTLGMETLQLHRSGVYNDFDYLQDVPGISETSYYLGARFGQWAMLGITAAAFALAAVAVSGLNN